MPGSAHANLPCIDQKTSEIAANTMPAQKVLVLGAGELGMAVLQAFAAKQEPNTHVTVMLRPDSIGSSDEIKHRDQRAIRGWEFDILPGDIGAASTTELAAAFHGFDTVISCTGFSAGKGTQLKIARAALAAHVNKFVPWQFGVDYDRIGRGSAQDLFDEQLDVRDLLRGQSRVDPVAASTSTQWMIVSTGIFCSFLFEPWWGVVEPQQQGAEIVVRALGSWENAVTVTNAEDIGTLTVELISSPDTEWNSVVFVAGDTVTYGDLARVVEQEVSGSTISIRNEVWTLPQLEKELQEDPTSSIKKYHVVFATGVGVSWDAKNAWNSRNGIKTANAAQWLAANRSVLGGQIN